METSEEATAVTVPMVSWQGRAPSLAYRLGERFVNHASISATPTWEMICVLVLLMDFEERPVASSTVDLLRVFRTGASLPDARESPGSGKRARGGEPEP